MHGNYSVPTLTIVPRGGGGGRGGGEGGWRMTKVHVCDSIL